MRSRSWVLAFLGGSISYHVVVLPAIFVLGPVLVADELDGARSWAVITAGFGAGCVIGDLLLLRWRPRFALRVSSLMLLGASCQAAFIGSGLGTWGIAGLEVLAGICVTGYFTLWETSLQEHVPQHALSRVASYDYLTSAGMIPVGNIVLGTVSAAVGLHRTLVVMTVLGVTAAAVVAALPVGAPPASRDGQEPQGSPTRLRPPPEAPEEGLADPGGWTGHGDCDRDQRGLRRVHRGRRHRPRRLLGRVVRPVPAVRAGLRGRVASSTRTSGSSRSTPRRSGSSRPGRRSPRSRP